MKIILFNLIISMILTSCNIATEDYENAENIYLSEVSPNITLFGLVCKDDKKIYYSSNKDEGIYAVDKDGKNKTFIISAKATGLLHYKGKIYFKSFVPEKRRVMLCSVDTDGKNYKIIDESVTSSFYIYDEMIYYKKDDYSFYTYNIKNEEITFVKEPEVAGSIVYKDKLYYYDEGLYGNIVEYDMIQKTEKPSSNFVSSYMQFYDNHLYFNSLGWITKLNLDTQEITKIFDGDKHSIAVDFISITKENIFFTIFLEKDINGNNVEKKGLYKIKHDGSGLTLIYENDIELFNIIDDKIFITNNMDYVKTSKDTYLKVIDFDGNDLEWDI